MTAEETTFKKKILNGFFWLSIGTFVGQFLSWISTIIVIRLLLPTDYGLMAMAGSAIALLMIFSELGIGASIIQAERITEKEIAQIYGFILATALAVWFICHLSAPLVAQFYKEPKLASILRVMNVNFVLISLYLVPQSLLIREMNFKAKAAIDLSAQIGSALMTLLFAFIGMGVWALVIGTITLNVIKTAAFNLKSAYRFKPSLSYKGSKRFISFGAALTGSRLFYSLYHMSDTIVVGKFLGDLALGIYSVALNLASIPAEKVLPIINQISFTGYSRIQNDWERIRKNVLRTTRLVAFSGFPIFWGMAVVGQEAIPLILGSSWVDAIIPFQLLCIMLPLKALSPIYGSAVFAVGKPRVNLVNSTVTFVIMTLAFLVGVKKGVLGVCFAWVMAYPLVFSITAVRSLKILGISLKTYLSEMLFPFSASIVMSSSILALRSILKPDPLFALVIFISSGIVIYASLMFIFKKEDYVALKSLVQR